MDVLQFILAIVGILGGEGILGLIFFKITKRQKVADVADKETDISGKQNDQWQEIVDYLKKENSELKSEKAATDEQINLIKDKYNDLTLRVCKMETKIESLTELRCDKTLCKYRVPKRKDMAEQTETPAKE